MKLKKEKSIDDVLDEKTIANAVFELNGKTVKIPVVNYHGVYAMLDKKPKNNVPDITIELEEYMVKRLQEDIVMLNYPTGRFGTYSFFPDGGTTEVPATHGHVMDGEVFERGEVVPIYTKKALKELLKTAHEGDSYFKRETAFLRKFG
ncbi:MAG: hypothetical protein PHI86_07160, partial [Candidatus Omnitrophica bacterium]|nr:hypothetical protein [Candidatus Omnitrophota bacterium]